MSDPGVHGDSGSGTGVDAARRAELGDRYGQRGAAASRLGDARPLLAEYQQAIPGQHGLFETHSSGNVVDRDHGEPGIGGEGQQILGTVVMRQPLVAVCDHGAAAVPAPAADDVHDVDGERICGPHHRPDVGVVSEVLDRDLKPVPTPVDVDDDRLTPPIAIRINDITAVAVLEQLGVIPRIVWSRPGPGTDSGGRGGPHGGTGPRSI